MDNCGVVMADFKVYLKGPESGYRQLLEDNGLRIRGAGKDGTGLYTTVDSESGMDEAEISRLDGVRSVHRGVVFKTFTDKKDRKSEGIPLNEMMRTLDLRNMRSYPETLSGSSGQVMLFDGYANVTPQQISGYEGVGERTRVIYDFVEPAELRDGRESMAVVLEKNRRKHESISAALDRQFDPEALQASFNDHARMRIEEQGIEKRASPSTFSWIRSWF